VAANWGGFQRLGHKPDSKHGLLSFVQELQFPFGVLFKSATGCPDEIGADLRQLGPSFVICDLKRIGMSGLARAFDSN
jgi:hypothetical protein